MFAECICDSQRCGLFPRAGRERYGVIILEEADFAGMNEEWVKWFPTNPPARQGAKLPVRVPGMKVSIAAIAEA